MSGGVLVAGVGNLLLGDDGFGVEVARRLAAGPLPEGTQVADFGIRGIHLAYQLLDGYDLLILVDAMTRGQPPGTLFVFAPETDDPADLAGPAALSTGPADPHSLDPASVLAMVRLLGGAVGRTLVVGCEPADLNEGIGLSPKVAGAVDGAIQLVHRLLDDARRQAYDTNKEASS